MFYHKVDLSIMFQRYIFSHSTDPPQEATEQDTKDAEDALLKAKAKYQVRNNVIEQTLIANPIVKAVHAASKASIAEQ